MRWSFGIFVLVVLCADVAQAQIIPSAAIEVTPGSFDRDPGASSGVLADVVVGDNDPLTTKWLAKGTTTLSAIQGFAHVGQLGENQTDANLRCKAIQIWGWLDTNGNGKADIADTTTDWVKLSEITPAQNGGDGTAGNVVGWDVTIPVNDPVDLSSGTGDILQTANGGTAIALDPKESWILCVRVVSQLDDTTNFCRFDPAEQWEDGNLGNSVGSNIETDKYYDSEGVRSGGPDVGLATLQDNDFVWIYVPKN